MHLNIFVTSCVLGIDTCSNTDILHFQKVLLYIRRPLFQIFTQLINAIEVARIILRPLNDINVIGVTRYLLMLIGCRMSHAEFRMSNVECQISIGKCQILNVNKVKLLSKSISGVPPVTLIKK